MVLLSASDDTEMITDRFYINSCVPLNRCGTKVFFFQEYHLAAQHSNNTGGPFSLSSVVHCEDEPSVEIFTNGHLTCLAIPKCSSDACIVAAILAGKSVIVPNEVLSTRKVLNVALDTPW